MERLPIISNEAIPGLLVSLHDSQPEIRRTALHNLGKLGAAAANTSTEVVKAVRDTNGSVRAAAVWCLGEFGIQSAVPLVLAFANHELRDAVTQAIDRLADDILTHILSNRGELHGTRQELYGEDELRNAIVSALRHTDSKTRICGAFVLREVNTIDVTEKLEYLEKLLHDPDHSVSISAVNLIASLTNHRIPDHLVQPVLMVTTELLGSEDSAIRQSARSAILDIGVSGVGYLLEKLNHGNSSDILKNELFDLLPSIPECSDDCISAFSQILVGSQFPHPAVVIALARLGRGRKDITELILSQQNNQILKPFVASAIPLTDIPPETAIETLLEFLNDQDDEVRLAAAKAIVEYGHEATRIILKLAEENNSIQDSIFVEALTRLGSAAAGAVEYLTGLLKDSDPDLKLQVINSLGRIGPAAAAAIPHLAEMARAGNIQLAAGAATALGLIGPQSIPDLLGLAKGDHQPQIRLAAINALGKVVDLPGGVSVSLAEILLDESSELQSAATSVLLNIGSKAESAIPILGEALMHHDRHVRSQAAKILSNIGPGSVRAIPSLLKILRYGRIPARKLSALTLSTIAPYSKTIIPALRKLLRNRDKDVVVAAAISLANIGPDAHSAAPDLIRALSHRQAGHSPDYRLVTGTILREASTALAKIGDRALASIINSLSNRKVSMGEKLVSILPVWGPFEPPAMAKPRIAKYLVDVIREIGPEAEQAIPVLVEMLQEKGDDLRTQAAAAIKSVSTVSDSSVLQIAALLEHRDARVRSLAAEVLSGFGRQSRRSVPLLISTLRDRDIEVKKKVIQALGSIGPAARESTPFLLRELNSPNREITFIATEALLNIGPIEHSHLESICRLLTHRNPNVRRSAAKIIGSIVNPDVGLLESLDSALKDDDRNVVAEVEESIRKLSTRI